jgi:hypothetical protein
MTLEPIPSEFPYICMRKFLFLFYQCSHIASERGGGGNVRCAALPHTRGSRNQRRLVLDRRYISTSVFTLVKNCSQIANLTSSVTVLRIQIRDSGSGAFLTPESGNRDPGWVKHQDPDPG